jgi:hypothetical protein
MNTRAKNCQLHVRHERGQSGGLADGSRGLSAATPPDRRPHRQSTPAGCQTSCESPVSFWHPSGMRRPSVNQPGVSSRFALLNPRLPSGNPSGCPERPDSPSSSLSDQTIQHEHAQPSRGAATDRSPQRELWVGQRNGIEPRRGGRNVSVAPPGLARSTAPTPGSRPGLLSDAPPVLRTEPASRRGAHSCCFVSIRG